MPALHLDALQAALQQLDEGIAEAQRSPESTLLRDGVIQRFEYTVDLAWKLIQRYLRDVAQVPESEFRTKKDLFRVAGRLGLLADAASWIDYDEARNRTAHTYDGSVAAQIYRYALPLARDARLLLEGLRNAA